MGKGGGWPPVGPVGKGGGGVGAGAGVGVGGGGGGAGQIPCRDFQRGFCSRGTDCRFAH